MNRPQFPLYRGAAVADATSPGLQKDMSVLVADNRILAIRPTPDEGILPPDVRIIDAGGSTIVPGMVDAHSHVTLPGGSHWIDRGFDPPEELLRVAEHNGDLLSRSGVRWARDVGSPAAADLRDGRKKALALQVRERWRADPSRPKIRVAGTWIAHSGVLQPGLDIEADDGPALLAAAQAQLDDGNGRSRASAWPTAPASGSQRERISAADPSGPTTSRGRSNRSSRRDSSHGRPSPPRPYAAENSSTTPTRAESSRGAPRTSSSSMEIRSQIRRPCGGGGAWGGAPNTHHAPAAPAAGE